jgi:hypothetical protein
MEPGVLSLRGERLKRLKRQNKQKRGTRVSDETKVQ